VQLGLTGAAMFSHAAIAATLCCTGTRARGARAEFSRPTDLDPRRTLRRFRAVTTDVEAVETVRSVKSRGQSAGTGELISPIS